MKFTPYLNFNGTCKEAFAFYEKVLGGKVLFMQTFGESPMRDQMPPMFHDYVLHATLGVGDAFFMASDAPGDRYNAPQGCYVSISFSDPDEADRIYAGLVEGGTVQMEIQPTFWAARFAMLTDKFGIPWMINCETTA
jgi:PhnB protein